VHGQVYVQTDRQTYTHTRPSQYVAHSSEEVVNISKYGNIFVSFVLDFSVITVWGYFDIYLFNTLR